MATPHSDGASSNSIISRSHRATSQGEMINFGAAISQRQRQRPRPRPLSVVAPPSGRVIYAHLLCGRSYRLACGFSTDRRTSVDLRRAITEFAYKCPGSNSYSDLVSDSDFVSVTDFDFQCQPESESLSRRRLGSISICGHPGDGGCTASESCKLGDCILLTCVHGGNASE